MAITPTGSIYKALKFDGVSSRNYGVYITGSAVFNAPERDVEMITIPGRNGAFALDNGRFQNITVSYPAGIYADNESDFAEAISEFRNYLCSKRGYCRLQDEYNPDEYRLAIYKSGLEVEPALLKAGEFTITFECKPQRFLTSGETKQTIANSGDTITNPTLFESGPLLELVGYGNLGINNDEIIIQSGLIGDLEIAQKNLSERYVFNSFVNTITHTVTLNNGLYNVGDTIIPTGFQPQTWGFANSMIYTKSGYVPNSGPGNNINFDTPLIYGTSASKTVATKTGGPHNIVVPGGDGTILGAYYTAYDISMNYDGAQTITYSATLSVTGTGLSYLDRVEMQIRNPNFIVNSTYSTISGTIFIDLDIGEAWTENNGEIANINNSVTLPAMLPKLEPGSNLITFNNTITDLKLTPRWWKV